MNYLILVNKEFGLDKNYIPNDLVKVSMKTGGDKTIYLEKKTYEEIKKLLYDINKEFDTYIIIDSGYRTYMYQEGLMTELLKEKGTLAYKTLALPGHSEHQTGLAVDIGFYKNGVYMDKFDINDFVQEFLWLKENAHKYGFIVRYPKDKENITGYSYEPWHLRYVGNIASFMYKYNLTLEEYLEMFA